MGIALSHVLSLAPVHPADLPIRPGRQCYFTMCCFPGHDFQVILSLVTLSFNDKHCSLLFTGLANIFALNSQYGYLYFLMTGQYFVKPDFYSNGHYYFPIR